MRHKLLLIKHVLRAMEEKRKEYKLYSFPPLYSHPTWGIYHMISHYLIHANYKPFKSYEPYKISTYG